MTWKSERKASLNMQCPSSAPLCFHTETPVVGRESSTALLPSMVAPPLYTIDLRELNFSKSLFLSV